MAINKDLPSVKTRQHLAYRFLLKINTEPTIGIFSMRITGISIGTSKYRAVGSVFCYTDPSLLATIRAVHELPVLGFLELLTSVL